MGQVSSKASPWDARSGQGGIARVLLVYNSIWLPISFITLEKSQHHTEPQFPYLQAGTHHSIGWGTEGLIMPEVSETWYAFDES